MKTVNLREKKEHNFNNMVINSVRQSFTKVTSFANNERNIKKLRWTEKTKVLFLVKDYSIFKLKITRQSPPKGPKSLNAPLTPVILDKKTLAVKRKLRLDDNHGSLNVGEKKKNLLHIFSSILRTTSLFKKRKRV